jgi:hypothetical protein
MIVEVNLIDEAGVLSQDELKRLKNFVIDHCVCSRMHIQRLKQVKVRDDGPAGYTGYWTTKYDRVGADVSNLEAVIILNAHYLKTVEQMEATLAHEFGHHWTIGLMMERLDMVGWFDERAPWGYYTMRGLDPNGYAKDYSIDWHHCDKEVLAEDYKHLFSPYKWQHRMQATLGNPTSEVADYIRWLGKQWW